MTILEKLWERSVIDKVTGCWRWQGSHNQLGYGRICINGENKYVHKVAFNELVGKPINIVCHKDNICKYKDCWNPSHLYDGTYSQNRLDSIAKHGIHRIKNTHCKYEHEFSIENTGYSGRQRYCKICNRNRATLQKLKRKKG